MNEDQILDRPIGGDSLSKIDVMSNLASGGKRFANMVIDIIIFYILCIVLVILLDMMGLDTEENTLSLIVYPLLVLYYWFFENLTGKTVGKYITRTRIVKEDGTQPDSMNILGRSLCRLIPFDGLSFLGSAGKGWHDSIPKIYVIEE